MKYKADPAPGGTSSKKPVDSKPLSAVRSKAKSNETNIFHAGGHESSYHNDVLLELKRKLESSAVSQPLIQVKRVSHSVC